MSALGMELVSVDKESVVMTMPVDERTRQPVGFLHGGASVALAETAASVGAASLVDTEKEAVFGMEINDNHIKSKRDGTVTAKAKTIHHGKHTMVWEVNIYTE